jgi:hypothetical protein
MHAIAPPDSYADLSASTEPQTPAAGGPIGVLSALFAQAREELRNGTASPLEPVPAWSGERAGCQGGKPAESQAPFLFR